MTEAYATIAAGGIHHPAQALKLVRDPTGRVLAKLAPQGNRVISPNTGSPAFSVKPTGTLPRFSSRDTSAAPLDCTSPTWPASWISRA